MQICKGRVCAFDREMQNTAMKTKFVWENPKEKILITKNYDERSTEVWKEI